MTSENDSQVIIRAGVIHQIRKAQFSGREDSTCKLQKKLHEKNIHLENYINYAEKIILKRGSNRSISGGFGIENTLSKILAETEGESLNDEKYLTLTQNIVKGLFEFVVKKSATTGEHIPVIFYTKNETDYLLISLISLSEYINIDENGEFSDSSVIDVDALKVGIQINIREMKSHFNSPQQTHENLYIRWIQRRSQKLPDYIQDFIPVGIKIDDRKATNEFISTLQKYLSETFSQEQASETSTAVIDLLRVRLQNGDPVHIEEDIDPVIESALAKYGLEGQPTFSDFRSANDVTLDSSFLPEKNALDSVEKFRIELSDGDITIRGKVKDLGRKVEIAEEGAHKYLKIKLKVVEYEQLIKNHSQLTDQ